jgi:hypothetical protein
MTPEEIVRKAIGTYPIFESSIAWMAMVRAVKMGQDAAYEDAAKIAEGCDCQDLGTFCCGTSIAAAIREKAK